MSEPNVINPFAQWSHIHFIGKITLDLEHPRLYRYELYDRFKKMFNKSNIFFPSPLSWPDLFEQRFLSDSFLKFCFENSKETPNKEIKTLRNRIFALCCTDDGSENADALWNLRKTKKNNFCIRYSINLWKMLDYLNWLSDNKYDKNIEFYVSTISYEYSQEELMQNQHIRALGKPHGDNRIPYLIRIMSYKRKAFRFENEIRIWAVVKEGASLLEKNKNILSLENFDWKNLGLRIHVAPCRSNVSFDEFESLYKYNKAKRKDENGAQKDRIENILNELELSKDDVKASRLYDVALWKYSKMLSKKNLKRR